MRNQILHPYDQPRAPAGHLRAEDGEVLFVADNRSVDRTQREHSDAHVSGIEGWKVCGGCAGAVFRAAGRATRAAIPRVGRAETVGGHRHIRCVAGHIVVVGPLLDILMQHDGGIATLEARVVMNGPDHEVVTGVRGEGEPADHGVGAVRWF